MATGIRKAGDFCWINLLTPEPSEAMGFFAKVLGWTYFEMPGIGHGMQVGGRNIGGLFDLNGPNCPPGLPPVIGVMVKVESVDATCQKVTSLGGTVKQTMDIGEQGRMAVCHDPNGANFDIWEPKKMPGTDADRTNSRRAELVGDAYHGRGQGHGVLLQPVRLDLRGECDAWGGIHDVLERGDRHRRADGDPSSRHPAALGHVFHGEQRRKRRRKRPRSLAERCSSLRWTSRTSVDFAGSSLPRESGSTRSSITILRGGVRRGFLTGMAWEGSWRQVRRANMSKMITCLWFDNGKAREAAEFYASVFPDSHAGKRHASPVDIPSAMVGEDLTVEFTVLGQSYLGLNGGPNF